MPVRIIWSGIYNVAPRRAQSEELPVLRTVTPPRLMPRKDHRPASSETVQIRQPHNALGAVVEETSPSRTMYIEKFVALGAKIIREPNLETYLSQELKDCISKGTTPTLVEVSNFLNSHRIKANPIPTLETVITLIKEATSEVFVFPGNADCD